MNDFLLGVVAGVIIGWLIEFFLYRFHAEKQARERQQELKVAKQQVANKAHELQAQSAEVNALRNKLAEAHVITDSVDAAQAELARLRAELKVMKQQLAKANDALGNATASAEQYRTKLTNCEVQLKTSSHTLLKSDDLQHIEGIGPKVSNVLIAAGIRTFRQLAVCTPEQVRQALKDGGMTHISNPESWPEQAALAEAGKWNELGTLQEKLVGGRRV